MNNSELLGGIFWLGLSLITIKLGLDHGVGRVSNPDTGFAVFWAGLIMCGLSIGVVTTAALSGGPTLQSLWTGTRWRKVVIVLGLLSAYALLFSTLGFLVGTVPLVLMLMRVVDPVRWEIAIPIAVIVPVGAWWILKRILLIQLPSGVLGIG